MATQYDLQSSCAEREEFFIALYKETFPAAAKYISKMGGSFDEAKDVFQDALVIYYEKHTSGTAAMPANRQAYVMGIVKHLWLKWHRQQALQTAINDQQDIAGEDSSNPSGAKLMHYLETAGQKCMDILKAFYYDNLPVDKIAATFGFSGVRSATVQKYKCMEKVRETIKERSLAYEDFID